MSKLAQRIIYNNIEKYERGENATILELGNCGLFTLPHELFKCIWVEVLILSDKWSEYNFKTQQWEEKKSQNHGKINQIDHLPSTLIELRLLKKLVISSTHIADLSPVTGLINLQHLSCSSTQISDLSPIGNLINLQHLSCNSTLITDLSPIAGLTNLQELTFDSTHVADLSPLSNLKKLQELSCDFTKITDLSPIAGLTDLQQLSFYSTKVSDLSPLARLSNLQQLSFYSTEVSDLSPLSGLINLQFLDCDSTKVSDLSPILFMLEKGVPVKWQDISEAYQEDDQIFNKPVVLVKNCPLSNPPVEIVQQGKEAIIRYFLEIERLEKEHGTQKTFIKVREAKVLIVGQGKSGKTTLRCKLADPAAPMPAPGDFTRGIEITRLDERMPHSGEPLRLNIWDFGGQDIQYYAHQFFLTGNSLYALVTNERIQDRHHLPYWLNIIEMLGKKSPVILIQNKEGGYCRPLKDEAAIRARFANVYNHVFQSDFSQAKTEKEFNALHKKIVEIASELDHIERDYLLSFNQLRDKLDGEAKLEKHYLRWDAYLNLMPHLGEDLMKDYANALTFLGVCQYFPDDTLLSEYVFLRPKWLIDALYELLLHPSLEKSRGHFNENNTRQIWKRQEYRGMHSMLVRMMARFELCYRVEGEDENYIIPQLLPSEDKLYGWETSDNIVVQFRYKFMPKGILTRLICRYHSRIEDDPERGQLVWNDAAIFALPEKEGRVFAREVYNENIIELRARGEKYSEILNEVIRKMDDINRDAKYDNMQVEKLVPCPCAECAIAEMPYFYDFDALHKRLEKGKQTFVCNKSGEDVFINEIFGKSGIKKPEVLRGDNFLRIRPKPLPLKVFISYSRYDYKKFLKPMTTYLGPLIRGGLLETWDDTQILPGESWDEKIKTEINVADIIFLLVSKYSLTSKYIWNVEMQTAMRRHEEGTARIVPIILSRCLWAEKDKEDNYIFQFAKLNVLPANGKPIEEWDNKNRAWDEVVVGVKKLIKEII